MKIVYTVIADYKVRKTLSVTLIDKDGDPKDSNNWDVVVDEEEDEGCDGYDIVGKLMNVVSAEEE